MNELFDRRVRSDQTEFVIFMAGGTASGKSSCAEVVGADLEKADIIVDGTLSNADLARSQIRLALELGKAVQVMYVFCEVKTALCRAVKRSLKINRTLSLNVFAGSHFHCRETIETLLQQFSDVPDFAIMVVDNRSKPVLIDQSEVRGFLEKMERHSLEKLGTQVYDWFKEFCENYERETGTPIPPNIRDAFLTKGREVSET